MKLAVFQPDIPQNTGTIMRLCACFGVEMHIIEPCGFIMNDKKIKRSAMDYTEQLKLIKHSDWNNFEKYVSENNLRIILMTTKSSQIYTKFQFQKNDIILAGRESSGVPDFVHQKACAAVKIPMVKNTRSFNVAISCAVILSEALRQTDSMPE